MKNLIRKLFIAKLGAGVVSGVLAYQKKKLAIEAVEQSGFFALTQRIRYHPNTHRSDGFYKVVYRFEAEFGKNKLVKAKVNSYRPIDKLMIEDGLEISIQIKDRLLTVSQKIQKKPLIEQKFLPNQIRKRLPGYVYLEQTGTDPELAEAYEILEQVLSE